VKLDQLRLSKLLNIVNGAEGSPDNISIGHSLSNLHRFPATFLIAPQELALEGRETILRYGGPNGKDQLLYK